jgi:CubicO group peptidase (beta-lactamase class C family)
MTMNANVADRRQRVRTPAKRYAAASLAAVCVLLGAVAEGGSIPTATPEEVGLSTERLRVIDKVVQDAIDAGDVAGVVTLVARHGRIAHFEAHGLMNVESGEPMRKDAIFRLASMSKPITAVAIMMLAEQGEIDLADPVARYIPAFEQLDKVAVPKPGGQDGEYDVVTANRPITIRDLLTHGSGLVSGGLGGRAANEIAPRAARDTLATYIPKLASVPLDFQPGTLWRYSGLAGFDVLGRIVEIVSGETFDDYLEAKLFMPLGMPDSGFYFSGAMQDRLPSMHRRTADGLMPVDQPLDRVYFSGAGGLAASAEDYLQFAQMLLDGGALDGRRYLGPRTVMLMHTNHTGDMVNGQFGRPAQGMGFGLSMQIVEDPVAADLAVSKGAYGWAGGTGVSFWIEPAEDMVSLYMIQGGAGGGLRRAFEHAVRQAIID